MTDELACPQLPSSAPGTADFPSPFCGLLSLSLVAGGCWGGGARRAKRCMPEPSGQRRAVGSSPAPSGLRALGSGRAQWSVASGQWVAWTWTLDPPAAHSPKPKTQNREAPQQQGIKERRPAGWPSMMCIAHRVHAVEKKHASAWPPSRPAAGMALCIGVLWSGCEGVAKHHGPVDLDRTRC
jgi:hypothetical protein